LYHPDPLSSATSISQLWRFVIHSLLILQHPYYKLKRLRKHRGDSVDHEPAVEGDIQMEYSFA
jgi:hypothetical protein